MIDFTWQRVGAERILVSFETFVQDWTTNVVKKREALDKQDIHDSAQSLFATDPEGDYHGEIQTLRDLAVISAANANANTIAQNKVATATAQG